MGREKIQPVSIAVPGHRLHWFTRRGVFPVRWAHGRVDVPLKTDISKIDYGDHNHFKEWEWFLQGVCHSGNRLYAFRSNESGEQIAFHVDGGVERCIGELPKPGHQFVDYEHRRQGILTWMMDRFLKHYKAENKKERTFEHATGKQSTMKTWRAAGFRLKNKADERQAEAEKKKI